MSDARAVRKPGSYEGSMTDSDRETWLAARYTEIATLAGGLAHEIKNPLSTLQLNLQLLAEDLADAGTQQERRALAKVDLLQAEVRRLEEILNDFLRFARVREPIRLPVDLRRVVEEMTDFFAPQCAAKSIVMRSDLPSDLPLVPLDADLFKQALLNLLINAEHAMPDGGELILRARNVGSAGGEVELDIIDTGVGMSAETLSRIFEPFFSTRPGGSGLGLATTRRIIEAHGGQIHADSESSRGTRFTISLPSAKP